MNQRERFLATAGFQPVDRAFLLLPWYCTGRKVKPACRPPRLQLVAGHGLAEQQLLALFAQEEITQPMWL